MNCHAKIVDCPPISEGHVEFRSHSDYVESTDTLTGKLLWHSILVTGSDSRNFDPSLEEDVQWNIVCIREVRRDQVIATDKRDRVFYLNKKSGKIFKISNSSK
jgi:hypothetical protein